MTSNRGIYLMLTAVLLFVIMGSFVKAAVRIPAGEAVFFRAFCGLPVLLVWLWFKGDLPRGLKTASWKSHAVRGVVGSLAMGFGFFGLKFIPLPEATAIRFATPMFIVILAALILGERIRLVRISAVIVGLIGVTIVMWPRLSIDLGDLAVLGALLTLVSAAMAALAQVFVKAMSGTEHTAAIVFYFSLTATSLSLLSIPFGWIMPIGIEWLYLIGAGLFGGMGQICATASYRYADASTLAPFTYASMIWALLIGFFVFGEVPTWGMLLGAGLVIAAGVAIVLRERALGMQRTAERKVAGQG